MKYVVLNDDQYRSLKYDGCFVYLPIHENKLFLFPKMAVFLARYGDADVCEVRIRTMQPLAIWGSNRRTVIVFETVEKREVKSENNRKPPQNVRRSKKKAVAA